MTRTSIACGLVAPIGNHFAFLEDAEQLGLKLERHLGDLVEQQSPAVRGAEEALAARRRAGEGALLVAEQHRLEHRLGKRGAVDRDERAVLACRIIVDRAGEDFLAGAGGSVDQDGDVGFGDALGEREQRQAFGVGGGRHFRAGDQRTREGVADRGVGGAIGDPCRGAVAVRLDAWLAVFGLRQDDGARGNRDRFVLADEIGDARLCAAARLLDRETLRAQRRDQRDPAVGDGRGWHDDTHSNPPSVALKCVGNG